MLEPLFASICACNYLRAALLGAGRFQVAQLWKIGRCEGGLAESS